MMGRPLDVLIESSGHSQRISQALGGEDGG